jgi:hypothetical protein
MIRKSWPTFLPWILGGGLVLSSSSCSKKAEWQVEVWTNPSRASSSAVGSSAVGSSAPSTSTASAAPSTSPVERPQVSHLTATTLGGQLKDHNITIEQQSVAGVPLEDSFVKTVSDETGPRWLRARHLEGAQLPSEALVHSHFKLLPQIFALSENLAAANHCQWMDSPQPWLRCNRVWHVVFKRVCLTTTAAIEFTFNEKAQLIEKATVSAGAGLGAGAGAGPVAGVGPSAGGLAHSQPQPQLPPQTPSPSPQFQADRLPVSLFPRGPKFSSIEKMLLLVASQPLFLFTNTLSVVSDAGLSFTDGAALKGIQPGDERFAMVQAYFYSSEALRWVREHLDYALPKLKVRVHVGHPERSNVAFYYGKEIRLGRGDGVLFDQIPLDPSIVIHETMHPVVEGLTGLPFQGEGGSLSEALCDFLTAAQLDDPRMGATAYKKFEYQRTLDNRAVFGERKGALYHDSLIVSGTLWQIRQEIGVVAAEDLLVHLLTHFAPDSKLADFGRLARTWKAHPSIEKILTARGF